jgi:hypothetical protein
MSRDLACDVASARHQQLRRDDLVYDVKPQRLLGPDRLSGQSEPQRSNRRNLSAESSNEPACASHDGAGTIVHRTND